jgi:hypothetical protein
MFYFIHKCKRQERETILINFNTLSRKLLKVNLFRISHYFVMTMLHVVVITQLVLLSLWFDKYFRIQQTNVYLGL